MAITKKEPAMPTLQHQDENVKDLDVLWVTNMAAPYRIPVWEAMQREARLKIALLESTGSLTADRASNRGLDWLPGGDSSLRFEELPTSKVKIGEARYYFPRSITAASIVRRHDAVVFGGWESPVYWLLLLSAKFSRKGCVAFYESTLLTSRNQRGPIAWARRLFFSLMDTVVVPGAAAGQAVAAMGIDPRKVHQGFNAVDVERFRSTQVIEDSSSPGHAFLYVGQLIPRKRVAAIVEAFSRIRQDNDTLTIVGSGQEDATKLVRSAAGIRLLPYVENESMPSIMSQHETLVLASSEEVWGLVVNEALASGLHVVVSENCGVVPSVRQMTGVFVTDQNLTNLALRMDESRTSWTGRVRDPEIMKHTPEAFAKVFLSAVRAATDKRERSV